MMLPCSRERDRPFVATGMHPTKVKRETKSLHLPTVAPSFTTLLSSNILRLLAVWLVSMGFRGLFVGRPSDGHRFGPPAQGGHQLTIWVYPTTSNDT